MSRRRSPLTEPYYLFAIFAAIALGTLALDQSLRLGILWSALALLSLLFRGRHDVEMGFSLASVGRGALLGLAVSSPLLAFLWRDLRALSERLYDTSDIAILLYQVCFVSAPVEEYFLRGIVQPRTGLLQSVAIGTLIALLAFVRSTPILVLAIVVGYAALANVIYAYTRSRHGLAASIACHISVGFCCR